MFAKAKGNWDLGEGLCAKGERTQGIEGDRMQVKYVRRARVHVFISITEKKNWFGLLSGSFSFFPWM